MSKYVIVTPEFGLMKGGIQSWAYYIYKALNIAIPESCSFFAYKDCKMFPFLNLVKGFFSSKTYLLMSWKMIYFIMPLFLLNLFFRKDKFFVIIHGNDFLNLSIVNRFTLKFLVKQSFVKVISNSNAIADLFYHTHSYKADRVFFPFIDFPVQPNLKFVENNNCLKLCSITRLVKRKNIESILIAISELIQTEKMKFQFDICGGGPEFESLVRLSERLKLTDVVKFLGTVSEEDKWKELRNADVFILPSLFDKAEGSIEGYGIVYIEANSMGTPVISGNTGGCVEAVIDGVTGIHTDGSVNEIKAAIKAISTKNFDIAKLHNYANKHRYDNQQEFITFISS